MTDMEKRKMSAYKKYFSKKYEEAVIDILETTRSLEEADKKLEEILNKFDTAWEQVCDFYHVPEEE